MVDIYLQTKKEAYLKQSKGTTIKQKQKILKLYVKTNLKIFYGRNIVSYFEI
jgi:hypothetical protein